ncbi:unnamed protein product [Onchocerca flexuosa]|uniref:Uncharacterized protein n=1 Tax=Onchocerca flexuosa TaxID=387005 RepID=A0A183HWM0_9BILA|nr:unnamed protein product [Onchocerca flexuosa]
MGILEISTRSFFVLNHFKWKHCLNFFSKFL